MTAIIDEITQTVQKNKIGSYNLFIKHHELL
jgi:hypothetical protein